MASPLFGAQGQQLPTEITEIEFAHRPSLSGQNLQNLVLEGGNRMVPISFSNIEETKTVVEPITAQIDTRHPNISQIAHQDTQETINEVTHSLHNETRNSRFTFIKLKNEEKQQENKQGLRSLMRKKSNSLGNLLKHPNYYGHNYMYQQDSNQRNYQNVNT